MTRHMRGQSFLEYGIIFCVFIEALLAMRFYFSRAVSGKIRASADELSGGTGYEPGRTEGIVELQDWRGTRLDHASNMVTKHIVEDRNQELTKDGGSKVQRSDAVIDSVQDTFVSEQVNNYEE